MLSLVSTPGAGRCRDPIVKYGARDHGRRLPPACRPLAHPERTAAERIAPAQADISSPCRNFLTGASIVRFECRYHTAAPHLRKGRPAVCPSLVATRPSPDARRDGARPDACTPPVRRSPLRPLAPSDRSSRSTAVYDAPRRQLRSRAACVARHAARFVGHDGATERDSSRSSTRRRTMQLLVAAPREHSQLAMQSRQVQGGHPSRASPVCMHKWLARAGHRGRSLVTSRPATMPVVAARRSRSPRAACPRASVGACPCPTTCCR